jgi:hypothetical protein
MVGSPILLVEKARKKRKETGDDRFYAPMEKNVFSPMQRVEHVLTRPFVIMFSEPMLIALTLYISVCSTFVHFWVMHELV